MQAAQQVGEKLKTAMEAPTPKRPLRRHRDDNYWDEIVILSGQVALRGHIVPRYKTSGLSGDEWRISAHLVVKHANPGDDLTCLLCHTPTFEGGERSHHPRCELGVRFLTMSGSAVAGLHRGCYERALGR
jgi:hypothetical protein